MLIRTKKLTKVYENKNVVDHLDLEIKKGQLLAYIGTNGAGKSTTIKMLTGLLKPTSGEIDISDKLRIGMVFQESVLDEELSVLDNLKSRIYLYSKQDLDWLDRLIEKTELAGLLNQAYGTLSGGQRRRVDIVRALLNKPDLLFLDEPTTGLDIQTRQAIWKLLRQMQAEENLTIFLTTHYLEEAENADMTYIIDHGKILAKGSAKDLKERFAKNSLMIKTDFIEDFKEYHHQVIDKTTLLIDSVEVEEVLDILSEKKDKISDFDYKKGGISSAFITIVGRDIE
jgi:multidrug/hemolysin transport system ATP-binding protein